MMERHHQFFLVAKLENHFSVIYHYRPDLCPEQFLFAAEKGKPVPQPRRIHGEVSFP